MKKQRWLSRAVMALILALILALAFVPAATAANAMAVFSDPSCGCCGAWVSYVRADGFTVTVHQDQPMAAVKARLIASGPLKKQKF